MEIQATKLELESLTEFQKSIHFPRYEKEPLTSKFYKEYLKTTWYCSSTMPLKSSEQDSGETVYTLNPSFHYLMYTYMTFTLPPIKVKPQYKKKVQISWSHNVGTNLVKTASFKEDELTYQSFDNIWMDDYFQYYMPSGQSRRRNHKIGVGSIPFLEEWTDTLPLYPINVDQPWYYGEETADAYPIYIRGSQVRAEHRYTFRRNIFDLLRMQILSPTTNTWINVAPSAYMQTLQYGGSMLIQKPTLWGKYAYITNEEINTNKCKPKLEFFIKDVESCDGVKPNKFGTPAEISLQCTSPCLAMFWKAENLDALMLNNHSNYTSNTDDLYTGWDPILNTSLQYGTKFKFKQMESHHFNIAESRKHFKSSPNETGYHAYSFAWDSSNYDGEVGVVLSELNAKLICKIANNDIRDMIYKEDTYINPDNDTESFDCLLEDHEEYKIKESPKFITRVRLLVLKKFTISKNADGLYQYALC